MFKLALIAAVGALALAAGAAHAEDWNGAPVPSTAGGSSSPSTWILPGNVFVPKPTLSGAEFIDAECSNTIALLTCPSPYIGGASAVPISLFARSSTVDALGSDVSALNAAVTQLNTSIGQRVSRGVALAAALDFQSPAAGKSNRLGGAVSTINSQVAGGINYTHTTGDWDFSAGAAFTQQDVLGKAAVGFSW